MLRQLQTVNLKNADALTIADVPMKVGMLVQKNSDGEAILPTGKVGSGVFFVTKERIATGLSSIQGELSDYSSAFDNIGTGEAVALVKPFSGEKYATDQYNDDDFEINAYLYADTDGKLYREWSGTTNMIYRGTYVDNENHTLALVEIVDLLNFTDTRNDAITAFSFAEQTGAATIGAGTVAIEVAFGTDVTDLVSTFALTTGATAKVGTTAQVSATTPNDFTNPVTYTVTATDGTDRDWVVTVTVAAE